MGLRGDVGRERIEMLGQCVFRKFSPGWKYKGKSLLLPVL